MTAAVGIAIGRDPLQRDLSPYEVLGLGRDAAPDDVDRAFRAALLQRAQIPRLTGAKVALERRLDRGLIDLFLYDPAALRRLSPSPLLDPRVLERARREDTAREWELQFRRSFPDLAIAHSLAVFWYWWAIDDLAGAEGCAEEHWRKAIGYWAMIAAHDDFWWSTASLVDAPPELRQALVERLIDDLRKLPARSRPDAADAVPLDLLLQQEYEAARELFATGASTRHGRVACGPLLLEHCGMLGSVRSRVDSELANAPGDEQLLRLRELLGGTAPIRALLVMKKPADALAAIERLDPAERALPQVALLRTRALLDLGREQVTLQRLDTALATWSEGLRGGAHGELERELREELIAGARTRAAALAKQPDAAIELLQGVLECVPDDSLRAALGELLQRRGMQIALGAQQRLDAEPAALAAVLEELARALADLEQAIALGSPQALEDLSFARDLISQATAGAGALELVAECIAKLEAGGGAAPDLLGKRHAVLLCNRAVATAQRAVQLAARAPARRSRNRARALARMRDRRDRQNVREVRCQHCDEGGGGQFSRLELPGEAPFTLCNGCAKRASALGLHAASEDPLRLLAGAERDLAEAGRRDAASPVIQKNLADVQRLRTTLEADPAAARESEAPFAPIHALFLSGFVLVLLYLFFQVL